MMVKQLFSTLAVFLFTFLKVYGQPVQLVTVPKNSNNYFEALGKLFFVDKDSLWISDGTSNGTFVLKDLGSAFLPYSPNYEGSNQFYFTTVTIDTVTLWRSNGTSSGTIPISRYHDITPVGVFNNEFYYSATLGATTKLYKVGTGMPVALKTLEVGYVNPDRPLPILNGNLYFQVLNGTTEEVWKTNGTSNGTVKAFTVSGTPTSLTVAGNILYFVNYSTNGVELWKSNGTQAGTSYVRRFTSLISSLIEYHNKLYFVMLPSPYYTNATELYESDGTENGTKLIKSLSPYLGEPSGGIIGVANDLLLIQTHPDEGQGDIFRSDGTNEGTILFGNYGYERGDNEFTIAGNSLFYISIDPVGPEAEMWQSDLTPSNTKRLNDLYPSLSLQNPSNFIAINNLIYFTTYDYNNGIRKLWKYNPYKPVGIVSYFSLVNAVSDQDRLWIREGDIIEKYPGDQINIRFNPASAAGSVKFILNGSTVRVENTAPYSLAGDNNGDYNAWMPTAEGNYTLVAQQFSGSNATGSLVSSSTIHFYLRIINFGQAPLVNAGVDQTIHLNSTTSTTLTGTASDNDGSIVSVKWSLVYMPQISGPFFPIIAAPNALNTAITNLVIPGEYRFQLEATDNSGLTSYDQMVVRVEGMIINYFYLIKDDHSIQALYDGTSFEASGNHYNIEAVPFPENPGSVKFVIDGVVKIENQAPYAVFGDISGDYNEVSLNPGLHTLTATPYSGPNATGTPGISKTITFTTYNTFARLGQTSLSSINAKCYPNPSSDAFNITIPVNTACIGLVDVYDETGLHVKRIFEGDIQQDSELKLNWNAEKSGFYILKVKLGNNEYTEKLIVN